MSSVGYLTLLYMSVLGVVQMVSCSMRLEDVVGADVGAVTLPHGGGKVSNLVSHKCKDERLIKCNPPFYLETERRGVWL